METVPDYGVCSICGKHATLRCGNCRREFYCDKSHQFQDWQRHKSTCNAWEMCYDLNVGRCLLATRDLTPGDVILSETPLVWGPSIHVDQQLCVGCGKQCNDINSKCTSCRWPVCKSHCEGLIDKKRHGLECALLTRIRITPRCEILLVIRMLILWRIKSKRWSYLSKLQSHETDRGPGTEAYNEMRKISQHLESFLSMSPECENILLKICGLIDVNALDVVPEGSVAIYKNASLLEHSCIANTRHSFHIDDKGQPRITVKAVTLIKKGEHLSTMYTHALWSTKARQEHLLNTKYFICQCKRCADPTELNTHLSTLKCPCENGFMLPKEPLNLNGCWSCDVCPGILASSQVAQLMNRLEEEVTKIMQKPCENTLCDLLSRLTVLLHPGHQYSITVSHSLIQLLPSTDPRKLELCKRILDTVTNLDPYGARLALYTAVTLRELATCPGKDKQALLSRAASLLKTEPSNSPGEKFLQLIQMELHYFPDHL